MTVLGQDAKQEGMTRLFLAPNYNEKTLPEPLDPRVRLLTIPAETIATLRHA